MKILWGIQLTGNGHIRRSTLLISKLRELGHTVDILTSGNNSNILPESKYNFRGITLKYNNGSINWIKTILGIKPLRLIKDAKTINNEYDLVISDFEPVSALFSKLSKTKSISISNQNSIVLNHLGFGPSKLFIKWFSKCQHLIAYDYIQSDNTFQPLCNIAKFKKTSDNIVVYLPYLDSRKVMNILSNVDKKFIFFTSSNLNSTKNVTIKKISPDFTDSLGTCSGVITHCGFSTTSETLILGKKLWAIPVAGQFEQKINSKNLNNMGVFTEKLTDENLKKWINNYSAINYEWKDPTDDVIKKIIDIYEKD